MLGVILRASVCSLGCEKCERVESWTWEDGLLLCLVCVAERERVTGREGRRYGMRLAQGYFTLAFSGLGLPDNWATHGRRHEVIIFTIISLHLEERAVSDVHCWLRARGRRYSPLSLLANVT